MYKVDIKKLPLSVANKFTVLARSEYVRKRFHKRVFYVKNRKYSFQYKKKTLFIFSISINTSIRDTRTTKKIYCAEKGFSGERNISFVLQKMKNGIKWKPAITPKDTISKFRIDFY